MNLLKEAGLDDPRGEPKIVGAAFYQACERLAALHFPEDKEVGTGPRGIIWGMYPAVKASSINRKDPDPISGARSVAKTLEHVIKNRPPLDVERHAQQSSNVTAIGKCPFYNTRRRYVKKAHLVFVLMPFREEWSDRIWNEHIRVYLDVKVNGQKLQVSRADEMYGQDVMEDVFESICGASLIVAECTGRNPNVLYELGLSHALGKRTVLLSQNRDDVPFDLGRFRVCIYQDNSSGYPVLKNFLRETVREVYGDVT